MAQIAVTALHTIVFKQDGNAHSYEAGTSGILLDSKIADEFLALGAVRFEDAAANEPDETATAKGKSRKKAEAKEQVEPVVDPEVTDGDLDL